MGAGKKVRLAVVQFQYSLVTVDLGCGRLDALVRWDCGTGFGVELIGKRCNNPCTQFD